jgi:Protein of unknown function (DUF1553)/Protein of unknown function (DUF1549)
MRNAILGLILGVGILTAAPPEPAPPLPKEPAVTESQRAHWAYRKPQRHDPPAVKNPPWIKTPVDAFIAAALDAAGLQPSPPLDRPALLRRITFDLTGLPPTPQELEGFLADARPDAYDRVVDRLLASPHFGERWAQHWLDVVRYADTNGYEADSERPHAHAYRDWIVRAFNEDKPYDRFLTEQVAGDLLAGKVEQGIQGRDKPEANLLIAAGLHRCGPVHQTSGNLDAAITRQEALTEFTNGVGATFLGLTIGCARCHDHKFDPISQVDYYRLQAFFANVQPREVPLFTEPERVEHDRRMKELQPAMALLQKQIADLDAPCRDKITAAKRAGLEAVYREALDTNILKRTPRQHQLAAQAATLIKVTWDEVIEALSPPDRERRLTLRRQLHDLEAQRPPPLPQAWTVTDNGGPAVTPILRRGNPKQPGGAVSAGFPRVLTSPALDTAPAVRDRLDLARWLTQPEHPLTARVIVNRLWQHHFGRGLVDTPNDFGSHGGKPSHPELLDFLAGELVRNGWSLKHIHRLMVLSSAYRQNSRVNNARARQIDPDNRLLWRANRTRLTGEELRDSMLAVAGTLNRKLGGPLVRVPLEPEVYELIFTEGEPDGLWQVTPDVREHSRRSLYLFAKRNVRLPLLEAFDQPDTLTSCPVRPVSTFAPQALILLNGPLAHQQSKAFAVRLLREGRDGKARIELAHRLALSRPARPEEMQLAQDFLQEQAEMLRDRLRARLRVAIPAETPPESDPAEAAALADFCLALFNRNEFLYVR